MSGGSGLPDWNTRSLPGYVARKIEAAVYRLFIISTDYIADGFVSGDAAWTMQLANNGESWWWMMSASSA